MDLYLVRHGQSVGNVLRTFHGQTDYPLTGEGRRQAAQAAEKLRGAAFTRCCASDLQRAWDTALICLEGRDLLPEKCPDLREQFVGGMEDTTWDEVEEKFPGVRDAYISDWFHVTPPGGESPAQMADRVGRCVDRIIEKGGDTLIAAHNGSLSLLLLHLNLLDQDHLMLPEFFLKQGCYSVVEIAGGRARLAGFNL